MIAAGSSLERRTVGITAQFVHLSIMDAIVQANSKIRKVLQGGGVLVDVRQSVFDVGFESSVVLSSQGLIIPLEEC